MKHSRTSTSKNLKMTTTSSNQSHAWGHAILRCEISIPALPPHTNTQSTDQPGNPFQGLYADVAPLSKRTLVDLVFSDIGGGDEAIFAKTLKSELKCAWLVEGADGDELENLLNDGYRVVGAVADIRVGKTGWEGRLVWWVGSKFPNAEEERLWVEGKIGAD